MSERILRLPEVLARVGLSRSTVYEKIKRGEFPKQVKIGQLSGWRESAINGWIQTLSEAA